MNQRFVVFLLLLLSAVTLSAQDFYGMVKKADSLSTPIYQASVEVMESGKPFKSIKTYFDGTFKFTPNKDQSYIVKISYDGYKDTTYMFTTNGKGVPSAQNVNVRLKKDGMRLMGVIKGSDENFPIKEATIVLRNVMTRKEERQTTGIDGRFNFKLDYETNYKVSIDKRSTGILNRYKDTSFYVATIGFNLPLDYKIDIILDPLFAAVTTPREGYDPTKANNGNLKPVIEVKATTGAGNTSPPAGEEKQPFVIEDRKLKTAQDANNKLTQELEKAKKEIEEFKKKEAEQKKLGNGALSKGKSRGDRDPEVVIITDEPVNKKATDDTALLAIIRQKEAAEKRALEIEAQIAKQKEEEQKKLEELTRANEAALAKAKEDSILRVRTEQERIAREDSLGREIAAARAKAAQDSIARVQTEIATREKMRQDSIAQAQAAQIKLDLEKAVRKAYEDSVKQVLTITRARATQDSLARVKAERDKAAHEEILRKAYQDSVSKVITATRAKFIKDSVTRVQKEQERIAVVLAAKRAYEDSMTRVIAAVKNKMVQDSVAKVKADLEAREKARQETALREKREKEKLEKVMADNKAYQDSVDNVLAFNRKKFVEDSTAKAKADQEFREKTKQEAQLREKQEQERVTRLLAEKKAYEDSVRNVLSSTRAQYIQDSLALVKAGRDAKEKAKQEASIRAKEEQERQARQQAARKAFEDSLAREVAAVKARFAQDSIAKAKATNAIREQARQDSIYRAKREQERIAKDLLAKRAYEDSINQIVASVREKFVRDSIAKEKAAQALRDKARQDSIALAKAAQERIERELIARRAYQDSIGKIIAAVQEKFTRDSIAKEKAAQALREKAKQDSIAQAKEAQQRVERERIAQQAYADSVRKVVIAVREKFVRDSIAKEKATLAIKEKAVQDSIALAKAAQERIARELKAKQAYEDSVKKVVALVHEKFVRDSIAKETAAQIIREKAKQDSIALALAAQKRIEQEKAALVAYQDSVNKVMAALHQKFAQDSINKAKADEERASRELALRKAFEDITTLRAKLTADSLIKVKAEAMAVEKIRQDSLLKVREAEAQLAKELAAKQAYVDSVNKAVAEARARYVQDSIAEAKANLAALEKARKDSIAQAKAEQERIARETAIRKATEDSIAKANVLARARFVKDSLELVRTAMLAEKAAREKAVQDSLQAVKATQQRQAQEAAMRKAQQDSTAKANAAARAQFVKDSMELAKAATLAEKAAREKAVQDSLQATKAAQQRLAQEAAMRKAQQDSIAKANAAARAQFVKDSVAQAVAIARAEKATQEKAKQEWLIAEQERVARETASKKAQQDSINNAIAARAQFVKDSIALINAAIEAEKFAREKAKQDSLLAAKAEQARIAQEAAIRKAEQDSINKANAEARAQYVKDSVEQARAQLAAEQAVRDKAKQDSLAAIKANLDRMANDVAARRVYVDSVNRAAAMAKAQAYEDSLARERAIVYAREKVKQDSLNAINEQLERIGNDFTARRAFVDSINRVAAMARAQAYEDSIARAKAKAQQQRLTKELSQQQMREREEREKRDREELLNFGTNSTPGQTPVTQPTVISEIAHDYAVSAETVQPDYSKMPAILFNKNTAVISEGSKAALKVLAQTLMKSPAITVNIYAFASADEVNTREVSLQRSDAVLRYLISNGASVGQIKSFYNGTTPSRNGCDNPNCPEGLLMQNRAVAYQLVQ